MTYDQKMSVICVELSTTEEEMLEALKFLETIVPPSGRAKFTDIVNAIHATKFQPRVKLWMAIKIATAIERVSDPLHHILRAITLGE